MTATTATRKTATDRRFDWIQDLATEVSQYLCDYGTNPPADSDIWSRYMDRVATEGPALGRTERWTSAVAFHAAALAAGDPADWIALQGSVYLAHAAE